MEKLKENLGKHFGSLHDKVGFDFYRVISWIYTFLGHLANHTFEYIFEIKIQLFVVGKTNKKNYEKLHGQLPEKINFCLSRDSAVLYVITILFRIPLSSITLV